MSSSVAMAARSFVNEKPVPSGLSSTRRWWSSFQWMSRLMTSIFASMSKGPISVKRPKSDDAPGPPWSQSRIGASAWPLRAGE